MTYWHSFVITVLAQVTLTTAVAAIAMFLVRRKSAAKHAVGVLGLAFVLASPALALILPRAAWLELVATGGTGMNSDQEVLPSQQSTDPPVIVSREQDLVINDSGKSDPIRAQDPIADSNNPQATASPPEITDPWVAPWKVDRQALFNRAFAVSTWLWGAGIVVLCLRSIVVRRQVWALANAVHPIALDMTIVNEAASAVGLKQYPQTAASELAPMPFVLGCWSPVVLLPRHLIETASRERLREVLIHEFAHIVRRDPWINFAQHIARIVFWPHAGVHWLNSQLSRSREEICDNFVLNASNSTDYAQTLLELAERCHGGRFALSLLGMFSRRWSLEQRIADILNPNRVKVTRSNRKLPVIIAIALGVTCLFVGGLGSFARASKEASTEPAPKATVVAGNDTEPAAGPRQQIAVEGSCVDQNSKGIPDVLVRVFRWTIDGTSLSLIGETRSQDDGHFSIPNVEISADASKSNPQAVLQIVATSKGFASAVERVVEAAGSEKLTLRMSTNPGTLSGVVSDTMGRPVPGVKIFSPFCGSEFISNCWSAVTDARGRYTINDLACWKPTMKVDPKTGLGSMITQSYFLLSHPDYALTRAAYSGIPQEVNVVLLAPAILEGRVLDSVSGKPMAKVVVSAQGIARGEWHQSTTDQDGFYRLRTNRDHFNIWAEAEDRIAIAARAVAAELGKTTKVADIQLVRGGFVVGHVIDGATGKPIVTTADTAVRVAHYGPARPYSGAAVTATCVNPDGSYRLRVAPGTNYVYLMCGGSSGAVQVSDGEETKFDLRTGEKSSNPYRNPDKFEDPDYILGERLRRAAREQDEDESRRASGKPVAARPLQRHRPDTPAGRLLNKLELQHLASAYFEDLWLRTMKAIVELGPDATPELIAELDSMQFEATEDRGQSRPNDIMLRCCGFMLRAIGDKRAVPALIRSIPKTLFPAGSDMGLRSGDVELAKWAQQHDLDRSHSDDHSYGFGRPVREIVGAIQELTGHSIPEPEVSHTFLSGVESQRQMKRDLFYRAARQWADWWELHAGELTQDAAYSLVSLPQPTSKELNAPADYTHYKTTGGGSNWLLRSVYDPKASIVFYDLDTGRTAGLPKQWREAKNIEPLLDEIVDWAGGEGFELMGTEFAAADGHRYFALRAIGLEAWELDASRWKMHSEDITFETLRAEGTAAKDLMLHFDKENQSIDPKATASFLYRTREGTPGLLFVGIEVTDDRLKPGGATHRDSELDPVAFNKGRRFGYREFEELK